jgi:hypothetical protein
MLNAPQQAPEFRPHKSTADSAGQSPINTFDCHISPVNCIGRHIDYPAFIRLGGVVSQPPGETYRTVQRAESPIIHRSSPRNLHLRRKRRKRYIIILLVIAFIYVLGTIFGALGNPLAHITGTASAVKASADGGGDSKTSPSLGALARKESACVNRPPASGNIYVRTVMPGISPQAQQIGGEWRWDNAAKQCLTPVRLIIATAPQNAGNCTQIAYVADNPGYRSHATSAPPLIHVVAHTGPACAAAALSVPTPVRTPEAPAATASRSAPATPSPQTAPSVAPPPAPAHTAPASCYPLSEEGNCYEPGEYCPYSDQGMSGVAGDGEAIVCEDNDGLRWEPA